MKKSMLLLSSLLLFSPQLYGESTKSDLDSLGTSPSLYKRAKRLSKSSKYRIVQKRSVDRNMRFEFDLTGSAVFGGDSYYSTQMQGLGVNFHFTPKISIGLQYHQYKNSLTSEGERVFRETERLFDDNQFNVATIDIDPPESSQYLVLNWYPIYGKLNLFDQSVTHFDFYTILGAGQMQLQSQSVSAMTAGIGMGVWWSKYISSRVEARYNGYKDFLDAGSRNLDTMVLSISIGALL